MFPYIYIHRLSQRLQIMRWEQDHSQLQHDQFRVVVLTFAMYSLDPKSAKVNVCHCPAGQL